MAEQYTKQEIKKLYAEIETEYYTIHYALQHTNDFKKYINILTKEERDSRNWLHNRSFNLTSPQSVKVLCVTKLLEYPTRKDAQVPNAKDFFKLKESCFACYAIYMQSKDFFDKYYDNDETREKLKIWDWVKMI